MIKQQLLACAITGLLASSPAVLRAETLLLESEGGTFHVPVVLNDQITLKFTLDSGATDVSIPADVFSTLVRTGTILKSDLLDSQTYQLADGSERTAKRFRIRTLRLGRVELRNVIASVSPTAGDLLLGQSFLKRLDSWGIDNRRSLLIINQSIASVAPLAPKPEPQATSSVPPQPQTTSSVPPEYQVLYNSNSAFRQCINQGRVVQKCLAETSFPQRSEQSSTSPTVTVPVVDTSIYPRGRDDEIKDGDLSDCVHGSSDKKGSYTFSSSCSVMAIVRFIPTTGEVSQQVSVPAGGTSTINTRQDPSNVYYAACPLGDGIFQWDGKTPWSHAATQYVCAHFR